MLNQMFHIPIPLLEKILRPILVYLALIVLLRVFGKRELAQLNPFDLVVLLSLSNTVQNAIIGNDNSVSGGIIGAATLLSVNWLVVRFLYSSPRWSHLLGGVERTLITKGNIDAYALKKELLSEEELLSVVRRQGFDSFSDVARCVLEPNGAFFIEGSKPTTEDARQKALLDRLDALTREVHSLRERLT
ncbi:MAG TPA: YetF domain-containing protein [Acidobacteriaceae bacterium]|nr:YetF domain-containing protein [Acidobacteriaceae bacterium]